MADSEDEDLEKEMERLAVEVEQRGGDLRDLEGVYLVAGKAMDSVLVQGKSPRPPEI
jgi:hypothetical protein